MIIPTKHEKLNQNIMVIGAYIIETLMKSHRLTVDDLAIQLSKQNEVTIVKVLDTLTFLYAAGLVNVDNNLVSLAS